MRSVLKARFLLSFRVFGRKGKGVSGVVSEERRDVLGCSENCVKDGFLGSMETCIMPYVEVSMVDCAVCMKLTSLSGCSEPLALGNLAERSVYSWFIDF